RAFHGLGMTHAVLKEDTEAESAFRRAVSLQQRLVEEFPREMAYRVDLAVSYHNLGDTYASRGDKGKAGDCYAQVNPLFQSLPVGDDRMARFAHTLSNKLWNMGKSQEALDWCNRIVDYLEVLLRNETQPERRQKAAQVLALEYYLRGLLLV